MEGVERLYCGCGRMSGVCGEGCQESEERLSGMMSGNEGVGALLGCVETGRCGETVCRMCGRLTGGRGMFSLGDCWEDVWRVWEG